MQVDLRRERGERLVRYAGVLGAPLVFGEADRLIRQFGSYFRAARYIRDRIRAERARVQEQIQAGHMKRRLPILEDQGRTDLNAPPNNILHGDKLVVGDRSEFTKSYHKCNHGVRARKLGDKFNTCRGTFIAKRIEPIGTSLAEIRSVPLTFDIATADVTKLPAFALNLSALAWQGLSSDANARTPQYYSVPFYRLQKAGALSTGSAQYTWVKEIVQNADSSFNYFWNRKETDFPSYVSPYYKHDWSNIRLLFSCGGYSHCTIHAELVQFRNGCGPRREYLTQGTGVYSVFDSAMDSKTESSNDVFWESFWAHRVVHPLSEYQNPDKDKQIKRIASYSIKTNNLADNRANLHNMNIFYKDGRIMSLRNSQFQDSNTGALNTQDVIKQPIVGVHAAGEDLRNAALTNQVINWKQSFIYNEDRAKDTWLFVYADMYPPYGIENAPCSFDFSVTNKYEWMQTARETVFAPP